MLKAREVLRGWISGPPPKFTLMQSEQGNPTIILDGGDEAVVLEFGEDGSVELETLTPGARDDVCLVEHVVKES